MTILTFKAAGEAAEIYARLQSEMESIEEALKEFAESHRDEVGRSRILEGCLPHSETVAPLLEIGFEKVPAAARIPADSLDWLSTRGNGRFVRQKTVAKESQVKRYLESASDEARELFRENGIVLVEAYSRFFAKLQRAQRAVMGEM